MSGPVVVLGGTGHYGTAIVKGLLKKGVAVRILSRRAKKAKEMFLGKVEVIEGDILNPNHIEQVLNGASAVVIAISAITPKLIKQFRSIELYSIIEVIDKAKELEIPRIIYISVFDPDHDIAKRLKLESAKVKATVEHHLKNSGLNWTIFGAPPSFEAFFAMLNDDRLVVPGGGTSPLPAISCIDVGEIVSQSVLRGDLGQRRFRLVGPETMTFPKVAKALEKYLKKNITVFNIPMIIASIVKVLLLFATPFSRKASYARFIIQHLKLLNNFPGDLIREHPNDLQLLINTFNYSPTSFEKEIHRRYSNQ